MYGYYKREMIKKQATMMLWMALALFLAVPPLRVQAQHSTRLQVTTENGIIAGKMSGQSVRMFKGVPFAAPPVGPLRWKAPQPVERWEGIRETKKFGPRAMQLPVFGDMNFRSDGMSEDCLYLNVWTPAEVDETKKPVLVYFYGGGFIAGDGSEPRYDGESMATKGIVSVTVNYRLGIFGFLAHPELSAENVHNASGNYGLMDQAAALRWVKQNIAAFGGDPENITIAGESAGAYSVSALMASSLAKGLIAAAIGESGSLLSMAPLKSLVAAGQEGQAFAEQHGAADIKALRDMAAETLLNAAGKPEAPRFWPIVDDYFFRESPIATFKAGEQAHVPLLAGWNSQEMTLPYLLGDEPATPENYKSMVEKRFSENALAVLELYPGNSGAELQQSGTDLASDVFIGYSTWKWIDAHAKVSDAPIYRYMYAHPRPAMVADMGNARSGVAGGVFEGDDDNDTKSAPLAGGAVHAAEIEYALGNLESNKVFDWQEEDFIVSAILQAYFVNFIKNHNPNAEGLPTWPELKASSKVMVISPEAKAVSEQHRERYLMLDKIARKRE